MERNPDTLETSPILGSTARTITYPCNFNDSGDEVPEQIDDDQENEEFSVVEGHEVNLSAENDWTIYAGTDLPCSPYDPTCDYPPAPPPAGGDGDAGPKKQKYQTE